MTAGDDGFHHPSDEAELVALVKAAYREGRGLRVRGAAHSFSRAVFADPGGDNIDVMLDRYGGWRVRDPARKLVEAEAGIHLGPDPADPTGTATQERSLLWQLADRHGWTLSLTGGVTHQTVGGFTATGSSGGSLKYSVDANLHAIRMIDGRGDVREFTRDDEDFFAMAPSVGLLGVVSTITLACTDVFAIEGDEAVAPADACGVDLFGTGDANRPSLERFLRDTDFSRIEWWPQRGLDRAVVWRSRRVPHGAGFQATPYRRFAGDPVASQQLISALYAILGNLDDLSQARAQLEDNFDALERVLRETPAGPIVGKVLSAVAEGSFDTATRVLQPFAPLIRRAIPDFFPRLADAFIPLDQQRFRDVGWQGLPMDNEVDRRLLPTSFTETWIPLPLTQPVMAELRRYFGEPRSDQEAYRRTGTFVWELYAAMPSRFWLNPGYSSGDDEWRHGAFRVNPYWFSDSAIDPGEEFFPGLWDLLREKGIPFRLHWGKYQPSGRDWVDFVAAQYPRWDDFLRLRAERDPNNIFLTAYWRDRFGLWDAPAPRAAVPVP
jgi:FAD/FMN-containing dehydrogenase